MRDRVDAVVHAVGEVDVRDARRAEHDRRAPVRRAVGVGAGIARPPVRLDLDDPAAPEAFGRDV